VACVAVFCCSVLLLFIDAVFVLQHVVAARVAACCCSAAFCCSVLRCVCLQPWRQVLQCVVAVCCCSVLQCVAVCVLRVMANVLQHVVAARCSVYSASHQMCACVNFCSSVLSQCTAVYFCSEFL